ncbi:MAG: hypothetical protein WC858_03930 [Parcubacteria group bacterium]
MEKETKKAGISAEISQPVADFIAELKKELRLIHQITSEEDLEELEITQASENMTLIYEKIRNIVDYKEDHLIKRSAIERILRRNLLIEHRQKEFSEQFINELIMAGYLSRQEAEKKLRDKVKKILSKYQKLIGKIRNFDNKSWVIGIASCEIEECLFPMATRRALVRAMFNSLKDKIVFEGREKNIAGSEKDIQTYIAVLRSLSKVDRVSLNFNLFKIYCPIWFGGGHEEKTIRDVAANLAHHIRTIQTKSYNPLSFRIAVALRRQAVYFNVFYEVVLNNIDKIDKILGNKESLQFASQLVSENFYDREMGKFWKRVKRSLFFLVITKILLAAAVEYPYDLYIIGTVNFMPILINLIFPPVYLTILSATIKRPSESNSVLIAKGIEEIVYKENRSKIAPIKIFERETVKDQILNLFFLLTFAVSFGIVIWILSRMNFNYVGIAIFLFLFSIVSFFNALVRQPIRELLIARSREGFVGVLIDTLSIPFVRIGKWLSTKFSQINILLMILDVLIEAPLKVFVRFIQDWTGFLRRKKEEMI